MNTTHGDIVIEDRNDDRLLEMNHAYMRGFINGLGGAQLNNEDMFRFSRISKSQYYDQYKNGLKDGRRC